VLHLVLLVGASVYVVFTLAWVLHTLGEIRDDVRRLVATLEPHTLTPPTPCTTQKTRTRHD
jgi:hypothetical protein